MKKLDQMELRRLRARGMTFVEIAEIAKEDVPFIYNRWAQGRELHPERREMLVYLENIARRRIAAVPNTPEGFYQRERFQSRVV